MNIYKSIIFSFFVLAGLSSCDKGFEELNLDKKNPAEVNPEYLVPNVQHNMADRITNTLSDNDNVSSILCQHVSKFLYVDPTEWNIRPGLQNELFFDIYTELRDLDKVRIEINKIDDKEAVKLSKNEKLLLLQVMSSYSWITLTDVFGPVPYVESLDILNIQPVYTAQGDIYLSELEKLSSALKKASTSGDPFGTQDIIYKGDAAKWHKFGASLLLRMAMRISDVDKPNSIKYAKIAIEQGLFESNDDNALLNYLLVSGKYNPIHEGFRTGAPSECASSTFMKVLKDNSDPRKEIYWSPNGEGDYVGNGLGNPVGVISDYSFFNNVTMYDVGTGGTGKLDLPGIFMDYAEVEFFLAEAAVKGGYGVSDAKSHFAAGVRASLTYWSDEASKSDTDDDSYGISDEDIDTFVTAAEARFDANNMEAIATEKWVALMTQGDEAWAEVRRLDFPVMNSPSDISIDKFPTRLEYPPNEYSFNGNNVKDAASQIGGDEQYVKLWWDVK